MPFILQTLLPNRRRTQKGIVQAFMKPLIFPDAISTVPLICHPGPSVAIVREVEVPHSSLLGQDNQSDDTARAPIPLDRLLQCTPHKVDALFLCHLLLPVRIGVTVDIGRARASDREGLLV